MWRKQSHRSTAELKVEIHAAVAALVVSHGVAAALAAGGGKQSTVVGGKHGTDARGRLATPSKVAVGGVDTPGGRPGTGLCLGFV